MGNFLNSFRKTQNVLNKIENKANNYKLPDKKHNFSNNRLKERETESLSDDFYDGADDFLDNNQDSDPYGLSVQPAQKSEDFYHYILENKYQDIEKSIRGYKDVFNKDKQEWELKRKKVHCFTDEEAENILRTAQSLLSTDIKLGYIEKDVFGMTIMMIYKRLRQQFREIAEYNYGRYSHNDDGSEKENGYAIEQEMKLQNLKIFVELTESIKANYSRSISGSENRLTHDSVSAQESLQSTDKRKDDNRRYA